MGIAESAGLWKTLTSREKIEAAQGIGEGLTEQSIAVNKGSWVGTPRRGSSCVLPLPKQEGKYMAQD